MPSSRNPVACRWHRYSTITELEAAAVLAIQHAAQQAISQHGQFRIVLAGGTTPRNIYQAMRSADTDWSSWHVYFGDERCLPPDHAERNCRMAALAWLDHVAIPRAQIHPMSAEKGPEAAAADYTQLLKEIEQFDLVLLGLGEDGHTASLFPGHELGNTPDAPAALAVHDAPKPPPERVSLSANRLGAARRVIFLVTGESKRQAVTDWRNGASIPAAAITPAGGADVYLEAGLLGDSSEQQNC
jgi:6-phosphogluconolactonase